MSQRLAIHVINGGIGESIVIQMPNDRWGVVDCYTADISDDSRNPTIEFLRKSGVVRLEFVCITHPHEDHYRGLFQLLRTFDVRYFWRFGAFSPRDLKAIFLRYFLQSASGTDENADADQLTKAFGTIYRKLRHRELEAVVVVNDIKPLYPFPIGSDPEFEITALGPSSNQTTLYEADLAKCFDSSGRLVAELPRQRHNDVSIALLLRFGRTRIILGGDVEVSGWNEILRMVGADALKVHGVKVSHHGSNTGYTPNLWQYFASEGKPHAVVTPFRRFKLPKREALAHIRAYTTALLTTCREATLDDEEEEFDFWDPVSLPTKVLIRNRFRSWRAVRQGDATGVCSLAFDNAGNCSYNCAGSASAIS